MRHRARAFGLVPAVQRQPQRNGFLREQLASAQAHGHAVGFLAAVFLPVSGGEDDTDAAPGAALAARIDVSRQGGYGPPSGSREVGTWYAFPKAGACAEGEGVGERGCTWKRQPRSRILWGVDLLAAGWNASSIFDERTGDRTNMTRMVATNIVAFNKALAKLAPAAACGPVDLGL